MTLVWDRFTDGGSDLLAMLALADWSNDEGGDCYPSMASIARKIRTSESQARRVVHGLIQDGWIQVVGNAAGGAPGSTRRYQIDIAKLTSAPSVSAFRTPSVDATPRTDATPGMDARDGSHPCAETGSTHASQTIIEPPVTTKRERRSRAQTPKGTRFALDILPNDWREFARKERPDLNVDQQFQIFADYWRAQPGQNGVKVDWAATWRNWIRRESQRSRTPMGASGQPIDNVRTLRQGEYY